MDQICRYYEVGSGHLILVKARLKLFVISCLTQTNFFNKCHKKAVVMKNN